MDLLSVSFSIKQFRFRFENTWLEEPSFRKEVVDFWLQLPAIHILPKLISVSSFMARWGRNFFHKFRDKIQKHKDTISSLVDRTDDIGIALYFDERNKLNDLLFHEEVYWKQRAKTFWLAEGDENTKFFHANASARRKTNRITHLITDNGTRVEEHVAMCDVVKEYFLSIFTGDPVTNTVHQTNDDRCVSPDQNTRLVADVSFEEFP